MAGAAISNNHAMWGVIAVFLGCLLLIPFDVSLAKAAFGSAALPASRWVCSGVSRSIRQASRSTGLKG